MNNMLITFDILDYGGDVPANLQSLVLHLIYDVNMYLTFKYIIVTDDHRTDDTVSTTYVRVASMETVRISLMYVPFNGLDILAAHPKNTYLTMTITEKHFILCGPEFRL